MYTNASRKSWRPSVYIDESHDTNAALDRWRVFELTSMSAVLLRIENDEQNDRISQGKFLEERCCETEMALASNGLDG